MRLFYPSRIFVAASVIVSALAFTTQNSPKAPGEFCRLLVLENMGKIELELTSSLELLKSSAGKKPNIELLKQSYREARKKYKEIEFFVEYYSPFEAKFYINGPLVPKLEMEISSVPFEPQGFQVIEENLFDENKLDTSILKREYALLLEKLAFLKRHYSTISIEENKLHEALKLQLIRIMSLTLNGYDCTVNKESVTETISSLTGIENIIVFYENNSQSADSRSEAQNILRLLKKAKSHLKKHPDSDSFNRLGFICDYLNPLYKTLVQHGKVAQVKASPIHYAVNLYSASVFDLSSVNKQHFSVYVFDTLNNEKQAQLGKLLFYDPILSGNNKRACASCHQADKAFTDGRDRSLGYDGIKTLERNSPTLINAAYQKLFFHDGRVFNLEQQAGDVFNNAFEMNTSQTEILSKLKQSVEYRQLFHEAFKRSADSSITFYAVIKSITEFIKTINSNSSRFDAYLRGNKNALSGSERKGYNLFAGKALCGSCHFFPVFNGTVPPMYNDNEFEVLGVPEKESGRQIDADVGREKITKASSQKYAFKTPTLRNIELTSPYMHNGIYVTLDSVIAFYNKGGGRGRGIKLENQTLPFDSLGLSKKEMADIKHFLLCLTDTSSLPKPPVCLPQFKKEEWNTRKIGGEY